MILLTIYAKEETRMAQDPLVRSVSKAVEGQEAKVRRGERTNVPCTLIVITDTEAKLA